MIKLVPDWAHDYEAFWNSIRNRNIWFIHIRYAAVFMLASIFLIASFVFEFKFTQTQVFALVSITIIIFLYNLVLHWLRKYLTFTPGKFNPLHLSLLQIILDLSTLMLLVYFTGSIETPLYMLFIFHMIIGSLILPGYVILSIAVVVTFSFSLIVGLEFFNIIPHNHLIGIHQIELSHNFNYIVSTIGLFVFTIFTTVLITSRIAKRLYKREEELIETLKKLDEAEIAKQKYTMAVVHEIKSPIVAVQSIIEIVKKGYLGSINGKIEEKLDRTIIRTEEALTLINNILRISKLKLMDEVSFEKIDLPQLIETIIEQKTELINSKNIKLKFDYKVLNKVFIDGDKVLLELIISNILGNAIKYNLDNGKILISLESIDTALILDISDSGIGIPEDEIKMIFRQFFRASNLPGKKVEGSGLGLSLVKEIVERLDGSININSPSKIGNIDNPGTSVRIILPREQNKP
jgi:signal transduction histidine kinase